ncbi:hypothetical protein KR059_005896 [Drosophila kikkawai]|nr:hypothetical protein KR059_005896 [Drosophila kikkawai]
MALAHGITLGWFSPTLALFLSDESPFGKPLTVNEVSMASSVVPLGALLSNLFIGWPLDFFGRKIIMYTAAVPNLINWILVYFGDHVAFLFVARFLVGFSAGIMLVVVPIFIAEIADPEVRGTMTSMLILNMCGGISLGLILGSYIPYNVFPFVAGAVPILYVLLIFPLPDTPAFLLKRGRDEKAMKSFYFYKNLRNKSSSDPTREAAAEAEFNTFRENVLGGDASQNASCRDFFSKTALKAFGLISVVLLCNSFSGAFAILNYVAKIFFELGSRIPPNTCGNVVGVFQLLGIFCAVLLVDRLGRRWLLIPTFVVAGLGELTVGLLKSFASKDFLRENSWLGLTLICFVEYMVSLGVIPLTFVVIVELLPVKILSIGASISMAALNILLIVVLAVYPLMISGLGVGSVMYMSAGVCFFGAIVLGMFLPETKGKQIIQ